MKEKVRNVLQEIRGDIDFDQEMKLIDNGILDSFDIISVVADLNEVFGIEITVEDLVPENFNSLDAITALVTSLQ